MSKNRMYDTRAGIGRISDTFSEDITSNGTMKLEWLLKKWVMKNSEERFNKNVFFFYSEPQKKKKIRLIKQL